MRLSLLLEDNIELMEIHCKSNLISFYVKMAENALVKMTNLFAKKLVSDKIDAIKGYINSQKNSVKTY